MSVPFGFSAGDFLTILGLVVKISQALDESSGSLAEFQGIKQELKSFGHIVEGVQKAAIDPSTISIENASLLPDVLRNCTEALNSFQIFLASYNGMHSVFKKVSWVTKALRNVRVELAQVNNDVSQEIQKTAQSLQLHVTSSLSLPYDQQPIKFQDALGRRYPVPLELCSDFQSFLEFLEFSFKSCSLLPLVKNRDLWLFTPGGEQVAWWYLLQEGDWAGSTRPGMRLGMSSRPPSIDSGFVGKLFEGASKAYNGGYNQLTSDVRFIKPLPPNAPYNPDTEFRYLTPPQQDQSKVTKESDESETPSTSSAKGNSTKRKCPKCSFETECDAAYAQHKSQTLSQSQFFSEAGLPPPTTTAAVPSAAGPTEA
ncbi:hypothetical protein NUW58_g2069 [Xylaria curta]|uniref:Uncharacterized protein n=1 Tax=Xylaria curta TaxID=42375 RepID=A0ACC1PHI0_9PEZI|nr:hypothetical protein NUW58_g2069 [Xylaria curta]